MAELPEDSKNVVRNGKEIGRRFLRHENGVLTVVLIVIVAILAFITKGITVSRGNISNILLASSTRGIASMGQLFVILTAGIDVSLGGIALASAVLSSSVLTQNLVQNIAGVPLPLGAGIAILMLSGTAVGAINGFFVARVGMPPLIVTLAMWRVTEGVAFLIGRGRSIFDLPAGLAFPGQGSIAGLPTPVAIFIAVAVVVFLILQYTSFGRSVYAVGGNPVSAWLAGINTHKTIFLVYLISGLLAGLAGLVTLSRTMSASMTTASGLELDSIAAVCIGGVSLRGGSGTVLGAVLGVLILGVMNNAMNVMAVDPAFQDIAKGWIIMAAVAIDVVRHRN